MLAFLTQCGLMIVYEQAACLNGWLDERTVVMETLIGIRRAGADIIFTYYARQVREPSSFHRNKSEPPRYMPRHDLHV